MITLLTGKKGSGKTKKLIEMANAALEKTNGNVVVVEKGLKLTYDISHAARLIDICLLYTSGQKAFGGAKDRVEGRQLWQRACHGHQLLQLALSSQVFSSRGDTAASTAWWISSTGRGSPSLAQGISRQPRRCPA